MRLSVCLERSNSTIFASFHSSSPIFPSIDGAVRQVADRTVLDSSAAEDVDEQMLMDTPVTTTEMNAEIDFTRCSHADDDSSPGLFEHRYHDTVGSV